jgi:hypothetical protein
MVVTIPFGVPAAETFYAHSAVISPLTYSRQRNKTMVLFFIFMLAGMAGIVYIVYKDVWADKKKLAK